MCSGLGGRPTRDFIVYTLIFFKKNLVLLASPLGVDFPFVHDGTNRRARPWLGLAERDLRSYHCSEQTRILRTRCLRIGKTRFCDVCFSIRCPEPVWTGPCVRTSTPRRPDRPISMRW